MLGAGQPTVEPNQFDLSQTVVSHSDSSRLSSPQSIIGTTGKCRGAFAGSLQSCLLLLQPPGLHKLITIHPVPQPPPSLWRDWEEWCCLHRLGWQGSAMHLKAGGEGLREGGGGEERVEEEEVVGCCSGYVLRKSPADAAEEDRTGPHQISESPSEHSAEMHSASFSVNNPLLRP